MHVVNILHVTDNFIEIKTFVYIVHVIFFYFQYSLM